MTSITDSLLFLWPYAVLLFGLFLGVVLHFLVELKRVKLSPHQYWIQNPYQTLICVVGALIGYMLLIDSGEMRLVYFIGYGFICDTVPNVLGDRAGVDLASKFEKK